MIRKPARLVHPKPRVGHFSFQTLKIMKIADKRMVFIGITLIIWGALIVSFSTIFTSIQ